MVHRKCKNGALVDYPSPVPWVGVYIAATSLVCTLLMIYDTLVGCHSRKRWLPCKLFKLDSVTLTLVSIVVKVPMDLTTPMPKSIDQLSKLCGTSFLCIYMCYIMPSLGVLSDLTNMYALSILVITVFVNTCIQMSTGLISLFIPEHIKVLWLMLILLLILWYCASTAKARNKNLVGKCKSIFLTGTGRESFHKRLKICYLYGFSFNPQFIACKQWACAGIGASTVLFLVILIEASIRSVILMKVKLCTETSDYGWSMVIIVPTHILSVIVGCLATMIRRAAMFNHFDRGSYNSGPIEEPYCTNPIWKFKNICYSVANYTYLTATRPKILKSFEEPIHISSGNYALECDAGCNCNIRILGNRDKQKSTMKGFEHLVHTGDMGLDEWTLRKSLENMENLIERSRRQENDQHNPLSEIFHIHKCHRNENLYEIPWEIDVIDPNGGNFTPLRLLPLVLLVRIAEVSLPTYFGQHIVLALREGFEILYFIEKHMSTTNFRDMKETEVAKAVWKADGFRRLLPESFKLHDDTNLNLDRAMEIIAELPETMPRDTVGNNLRILVAVINSQTYSSAQALYYFLENLFVESLEKMLPQLPEAIFTAVCGSPAEEFEERVTVGLKYLCKFESWEGIIWETPKECNCSSLLDNVTTATEDEAPKECIVRAPAPNPRSQLDYAESDESSYDEEIIEVGV